jgi:hypothetical protein
MNESFNNASPSPEERREIFLQQLGLNQHGALPTIGQNYRRTLIEKVAKNSRSRD